jgi:UDP-N-acetyl-D-mannosaminuronic acid dehydrogenase
LTSSSDPRVAVVGLGFVGLTFAVALSENGFRVIGVERDETKLTTLSQGLTYFHEPGLREALGGALADKRLTLCGTLTEAGPMDAYVITVGTPLNESTMDTAFLDSVVDDLSSVMSGSELVIMRSTVLVGTSRRVQERLSTQLGVECDVAACPERTVEGDALRELRDLPQVVGGVTPRAQKRAAQVFRRFGVETVIVSSAEAAEIVKLTSNAYRDLTFGFANEVAMISHAAGVSAHEVIGAVNHGYRRAAIAQPGPVGGPCLEKDPWILVASASAFGVEAHLTAASRRTNESLPRHIAALAESHFSHLKPPSRVAILGLAFKGQPATDDTRGSLSFAVAAEIRERFPAAAICGWDPMARVPNDQLNLMQDSPDVEALLVSSDIIIVMTNHEYFDSEQFRNLCGTIPETTVVIDVWNRLPSLCGARIALGEF